MTDEFTKDTIKKFGPRGSPIFEREQKTTDLEDLAERVEATAVPFCTCGAPITGTAEVYRCCTCDLICCQRCHIELSRWHYCPTCARHRFDLDKRTFLSLVLLDHDRLAPDDLVTVTADPMGEIFEVDVDATATALVANDYLTDDGELAPEGKEALHVGQQLYGDDADIQAVMDQLRLQAVVDQG
jgi:hypothetical protein